MTCANCNRSFDHANPLVRGCSPECRKKIRARRNRSYKSESRERSRRWYLENRARKISQATRWRKDHPNEARQVDARRRARGDMDFREMSVLRSQGLEIVPESWIRDPLFEDYKLVGPLAKEIFFGGLL